MRLQVDAVTNLNARAIVEAGSQAIRGGDTTIDFTGVVRCDTAAVACVLAWQRVAQARGATLVLVAVPRDLLSLATLGGVASLIPGAPPG